MDRFKWVIRQLTQYHVKPNIWLIFFLSHPEIYPSRPKNYQDSIYTTNNKNLCIFKLKVWLPPSGKVYPCMTISKELNWQKIIKTKGTLFLYRSPVISGKFRGMPISSDMHFPQKNFWSSLLQTESMPRYLILQLIPLLLNHFTKQRSIIILLILILISN